MKCAIVARSKESVQSWLAGWMVKELALESKEVDPAKAFLTYGMNSVQAMVLVGDLEDSLGCRLPPTLVWDYPSPEALAQHLVERTAAAPSHQAAGPNRAEQPGDGDQKSQTVCVQPSGRSGDRFMTPSSLPTSALDAEALLGRLDQMSEAEMDALLEGYLKRAGTRP